MTRSIDWSPVTVADVYYAIAEFDRLGPAAFYESTGYRPPTSYELHAGGQLYPTKGIMGIAYEHATGEHLKPSDFEGGPNGAGKILTRLGFEVRPRT